MDQILQSKILLSTIQGGKELDARLNKFLTRRMADRESRRARLKVRLVHPSSTSCICGCVWRNNVYSVPAAEEFMLSHSSLFLLQQHLTASFWPPFGLGSSLELLLVAAAHPSTHGAQYVGADQRPCLMRVTVSQPYCCKTNIPLVFLLLHKLHFRDAPWHRCVAAWLARERG
jgi:hypothetical protein